MSDSITDNLLQNLIAGVEDEALEAKALSTSFALGQGVRVPTASQRPLYSFTLSNAPRLQEEARGRLVVNGTSVECTVLSRRSDGLDVATFIDLGEEIESATLTVDRSEVLATLAARLESIRGDNLPFQFNRSLAGQVMDHASIESSLDDSFIPAPDDLTADQQEAFRRAARNKVTYLWGPPGTGKTVTLSALALRLFSQNERVLLVSHTNRAVDGIVLGLCKRIVGKSRAAIPEGSVVRIGGISRKGLGSTFGAQIGLESLIESHQKRIKERIATVRKERESNAAELEGLRHQYGLVARRKVLEEELASLQKMLQEARGSETKLASVLRVLRVRYGNGGEGAGSINDIKRSIKTVTSEIFEVTTTLANALSPEEIHDEIAASEERDASLAESIQDLEALLEDPSRAVIERARVVACTASQAVLRCASLGEFDAVIVDEASMLPLPFVAFLAGLAKSKVVVGGDFRQLPPISLSQTQSARQWFARDVFDLSGIVDLVDRQEESPFLATLTTQFRGHKALSDLINDRFYGGRLQPKNLEPSPLAAVDGGVVEPPEWLVKSAVLLVDTSALKPIGHVENRSKVNLPHALLVRDICCALRGAGLLSGANDVGVIAPYRPQVALIEDLLDESGLTAIAVGTSHRFQGAERDTIVVDLTESSPHSVGTFLGASSLRDAGAKLLNVSLSRAQVRLIVVANLSYLSEQLRERHVLAGIIDDMKRVGAVVDARDIVRDAVSGVASAASDVHALQRFDGETFLAGITTDLREARSSVVIASTRITARAAHIIATVMRASLDRGVALTIVTEAQSDGSDSGDWQEAQSALEGSGAKIILSRERVFDSVVIDDEVLWLGNTPPLDCLDRPELFMVRVVGAVSAGCVRALVPTSAPVGVSTLVAANG